MRSLSGIAIGVLLAASALCAAGDQPRPPVPPGAPDVPCVSARSTDCEVSPAEMKQARDLFQRGMRLRASGRGAEALESFEQASRLVPRNLEFATAREITRQALAVEHLHRGNALLDDGKKVEAMAAFRAALELDPSNEFALQRLRDSLGERVPARSPALQRVEESSPIVLSPQPGTNDFHFRGDARALMTAVLGAFGITATVDDTVAPRAVRFDLENADYFAAVAAAQRATKTFLVPLSKNEAVVVPDTVENRQQLERMSLQTFYLSATSAPQQLNELMNALRTLFDVRFMSVSAGNASITVRAPQAALEAAARFLASTQGGPPQVLLDVKVYQVSRSALRSLGIDLPLQFQMFNLTAAALALGGGTNIQSLINQLFATGAINQANSQAIQALLAQLQNQQTSIFSTPFATFGGGITRFGLSIPAATARAQFNQSNVSTLEHLTLRASQNNPATFRVGSRVPILNAIFSPIFNTASVAQVIQNNSFQAPFPSFNYEDLGVILKATPLIHGDRDVSLKLELQFKSLTGAQLNGVPVISNREYQGSITVLNGESAVVVGTLSESDQRTLRGLPGLGGIPGLGRLVASEQNEHTEDELLVTITPHIISVPDRTSTLELMRR